MAKIIDTASVVITQPWLVAERLSTGATAIFSSSERQHRHRQHGERGADEPRQAEQGDEGGAEHGAQHHEVALGEIEDVGRPIEDVESHRHQRIEAAGGERADQQVEIHAYLAISRKMPIAFGSLPDATEASAMSSMPIAV